MFLKQVKAKDKKYLYLCAYTVRDNFPSVAILYSFGRVEMAVKNFHDWKENFHLFPNELKEMGCNQNDLKNWIKQIEKKMGGKAIGL